MSRKLIRSSLLTVFLIVSVSMAALAVGEVSLNGSVVFNLNYNGAQDIISGTHALNLNTSLKGTSVRFVLGDDWVGNWTTQHLAETYPMSFAYQLRPYIVTVDIRGAYWDKGPKVITTLGDFTTGLPLYVSGHANKNYLKGVKIADMPILDGKIVTTAFFGWQKFGAAQTLLGNNSKFFYNSGFKTTISKLVPGLKIDLYAINHQHRKINDRIEYGENLDNILMYDYTNASRPADSLIVFTPGNKTGTNPWGYEVYVEDGVVKNVQTGTSDDKRAFPTDKPLPDNGYVISAHGTKNALIQTEDFAIGKKVNVIALSSPKTSVAETTVGLEPSYSIGKLNVASQLLYRTTASIDITGTQVTKDSQKARTANADYSLDLAPIKSSAKVNAGFRLIDQKFAPFARRTSDSWYTNVIDNRRGQTGGNGGLTLNLPAKTTVVTTGDYYFKNISKQAKDAAGNPIKDAENKDIYVSGKADNYSGSVSITNSNFFDITAVAKVSASRAVETLKDEIPANAANLSSVVAKNALTPSASLERKFVFANKDDLNAKYQFSTTNLWRQKIDDITFNNKVTLTANVSLPYVKKVKLTTTAAIATVNKTTTPTLTAKLEHTLPNGIAFEANASKTGKKALAWSLNLKYTASW